MALAALLAARAWGQEEPRRVGDLHLETRSLSTTGGTELVAEFGSLIVLETRGIPASNLVELAFVRVHSTAPNPRAPVVYLPGGPGNAATPCVNNLDPWLPILQVCDLIFLDPRGTGDSRPNLTYSTKAMAPDLTFEDETVARDHLIASAREAAGHFRRLGIDLDAYHSVACADDIDDLRVALGLKTVSLFGFSYGTHLALATLRRHGDHIEDVVGIGVEGLDRTYKLPRDLDVQLEKLSLMVSRDPQLGPRIPNLMELIRRVLRKLDSNPLQVEIRDPATDLLRKVSIGPYGLMAILRRDLGDTRDLAVFPRLLTSIDQADTSVLRWFVQKRWPRPEVNLASILVDCASGVSAGRRATIHEQAKRSAFGNITNQFAAEVGDALGVNDLGDDYRSPVVSNARALLVSGSLDFNTPPYGAETVRWGLPNSIHLVVANAGHEQIWTHPGVPTAIARFLGGAGVEDARIEWPSLRFVPLNGSDGDATHPAVPQATR